MPAHLYLAILSIGGCSIVPCMPPVKPIGVAPLLLMFTIVDGAVSTDLLLSERFVNDAAGSKLK